MARLLQHAIVMVLLSVAASVSPVEKVIGLLEGMKSEIESDATSEAVSYDKFACFCKETTTSKATSITDGQDSIDKLSASIAENTATKASDESKVQGLKTKKEELSTNLADTTAQCAKEKAEYEAIAADFTKAISSLKSAIKGMADKQKAMDNVKAASALLEVDTGLRETLDLADAMGLVKAPKQKAFLQGFSSSLLQEGEPGKEAYSYHSQDIVDLLESLKTDFTKEKTTLDEEHGKSTLSYNALKASLEGKIETNTEETETTDEKISKLGGKIAEDRGSLVETQDLMKDDEVYMKDLTGRCESRAVEFDQRSQMRADEIKAISTALELLGGDVKTADTAVNARALLLNAVKTQVVAKPLPEEKEVTVAKAVTKAAAPKATEAKVTEPKKKTAVMPSFLQRIAVSEHSQNVLDQSAKEQLAKEQAVTAIENAGLQLKSPLLSALAMQVAADPFKKVKNLIQGLIERLIKEAAGEATKKGFCDTEMGKATHDREFRWTRTQKLTAEIKVLQAKFDSLTEEVDSLGKSLVILTASVKESGEIRAQEKEQNQETLKTAKEGLTALKEALLVLRSFYKQAAKAAVFLQASPVDEDNASTNSGSYQGKQGSSNAVLAILETIASDFERTIRSTETEEDRAAKDYVKTQRATKADIGGKTTKKELDEQDLKTTSTKLETKKADMQTNMDLVDDAVKTLMELKPTCVDSGMSYKERVEKRAEEVTALKGALCLLDTEKVEADCQ